MFKSSRAVNQQCSDQIWQQLRGSEPQCYPEVIFMLPHLFWPAVLYQTKRIICNLVISHCVQLPALLTCNTMSHVHTAVYVNCKLRKMCQTATFQQCVLHCSQNHDWESLVWLPGNAPFFFPSSVVGAQRAEARHVSISNLHMWRLPGMQFALDAATACQRSRAACRCPAAFCPAVLSPD